MEHVSAGDCRGLRRRGKEEKGSSSEEKNDREGGTTCFSVPLWACAQLIKSGSTMQKCNKGN